jgi:hypothetical protein
MPVDLMRGIEASKGKVGSNAVARPSAAMANSVGRVADMGHLYITLRKEEDSVLLGKKEKKKSGQMAELKKPHHHWLLRQMDRFCHFPFPPYTTRTDRTDMDSIRSFYRKRISVLLWDPLGENFGNGRAPQSAGMYQEPRYAGVFYPPCSLCTSYSIPP